MQDWGAMVGRCGWFFSHLSSSGQMGREGED